MKRDLAALSAREVDLVVVGGGMFGVCAAWDAVLRGMSVALVERNDFASGTSAHSFKMVHGGVRYIQHADLVRVRRSCRERSALLRVAPHLVQPLPIVIPTYAHGRSGKEWLAAGLLAYDLITLDRNRWIADRERRIPRSRLLSASQTRTLFPSLKRPDLTGAAVVWDAQIYNPTRLALAFLRSAVEAGAIAANYVEATAFLWSDARVVGIVARDRLSGQQFDIRARAVLNAAGPWAERLLATHDRLRLERKTTYSRDACFVVRHRLNDRYAVAVSAATRDADAVLSRGARHLFIVPWRDYSLVGVWHRVYVGDPDRVQVEEAELAAFIDEINQAYPGLEINLGDVSMCNSGLLPFGGSRPDARDLSYGKRSILVDHAREHQVDGLVTLIGIRYTMGRGDAARAVDLIAAKLDRRLPRPATDRIPVVGGRIEGFEDFVEEQQRHWRESLPAPVVRALLHNYGTEYRRVLDYAKGNPVLLKQVGAGPVIGTEVVHAVREEMAVRLADVVFRRTDLATAEHPGQHALAACARLMADELGWNADRIQVEVRDVERAFAPWLQHRPPEGLPA
jgi:glycerol-3-phosphate dehydrogenase